MRVYLTFLAQPSVGMILNFSVKHYNGPFFIEPVKQLKSLVDYGSRAYYREAQTKFLNCYFFWCLENVYFR